MHIWLPSCGLLYIDELCLRKPS